MADDNKTNWSAVVNELLDQYIAEGGTRESVLQQRLEHAKDRRDQAKREHERWCGEVDALKTRLKEKERSLTDDIIDMAETFNGDPDDIDAGHVAARKVADNHEITADQAAKRIRGRLE